MSLRAEPVGPIPEETARVARAAFPSGNRYMQMRDVLGVVYDDASFRAPFAVRGRPAESPWRLALVTVVQFAEGLSDRQASEAVRARIDWKHALGLELTDAGCDFSVLSALRTRLIGGSAELLLLDAGYVRGPSLVASQHDHRIDLIGPIYEDHPWQAKAKQGFDVAHFRVDWDARRATCPQGKVSVRWCETDTARGRTMVAVGFSTADCSACPARARCTRAKTGARNRTLQPRAEHEAIQAARQRQHTTELAAQYAPRAGIEGTPSQGIRAFGPRKARYRGLAKTHSQHVATATAINLVRLADWLNGTPRATTRRSAFAALPPTG